MSDDPNQKISVTKPDTAKRLSPQARRALEEAEARRTKAAQSETVKGQKEFQGPSGPEPIRFGDWERKGIASDF